MASTKKTKTRLTRQDWIEAAFSKLVQSGVAEITVERLAAGFGVTRGSFYYHFTDRMDLLQAVLAHWADHHTVTVRKAIEILQLDPATTLLALMRAIRKTGAADFDAPIRAWALHDPMAREAVQKVDEDRLEFIQLQFENLGFRGLDAENRARLLLGFEMSAPAMFAKPDVKRDDELLVERHRFLTTATTEEAAALKSAENAR